MAANQASSRSRPSGYLSADGLRHRRGRRRRAEARRQPLGGAARAGWLAAGMATALMTVFGLLFCTSPRLLIAGFSTDPGHRRARRRSASWSPASPSLFMAFAIVTGMSLRGAGDTRTVSLSTIVCALARAPLRDLPLRHPPRLRPRRHVDGQHRRLDGPHPDARHRLRPRPLARRAREQLRYPCSSSIVVGANDHWTSCAVKSRLPPAPDLGANHDRSR